VFDTDEELNRMVERQLRQKRMIHRLIYDSRGCAHCSCDTWSIALPAPAVRTHWVREYLDGRVQEAYLGHVLSTKARKESQPRPVEGVRRTGRLMNNGKQKEENRVITPVTQTIVT